MKILLLITLALLTATRLRAQTPTAHKDVSSIENITKATLESISGNRGAERDWKRFRKLFWPTAQLNALFHKGDSTWLKVNTLDEFVLSAGTWYKDNGFKEYELKSRVDKFGDLAHVFQSYGASWAGGAETERGINSFQLAYIDNRWWIVNLLWDSETDKHKLPTTLLK